jgi:hypothetical protein
MRIGQDEYINARERFSAGSYKPQPKFDEVISKIVGKPVLANDRRLLALIVKWKAGKSPDSMVPDNFLSDPQKLKELIIEMNK